MQLKSLLFQRNVWITFQDIDDIVFNKRYKIWEIMWSNFHQKPNSVC